MKLSKEEMRTWMLDKVKNSANIYEAECWLVTARTLGTDYQVEESAYQLQCHHKNVNSAAETLQRMYVLFNSTDSRFWDQVMRLIDAVKDDSTNDEVSLFRRAVFQSLLPDLQQTILLELAEKQTEKVEQCRFLLLLLRLFPDSASTFGMQLIDVLTELEKNAQAPEPYENVYTQLLVSDVLPVLLRSPLKLTETVCLELLKRAMRFYLSALSLSNKRKQSIGSTGSATISAGVGVSPRGPRFKSTSRGGETPIADYHHQMEPVGTVGRLSDTSWEYLLQCFTMIAERCQWEVGKKMKNFSLDHIQNTLALLVSSSASKTESLFTSLLIFLNLVFKYSMLAGAGTGKEGPNMVVVLVPPTLREFHVPMPIQSEGTPPLKISKLSTAFPKDDVANVNFLPSTENEKVLMDIFSVGKSCLKLVSEGNWEDLVEKLLPKEKQIWVWQFVRDSQLLNGEFRTVCKGMEKIAELEKSDCVKLQLASCYLAMGKTSDCVRTLISMGLFQSDSTAPTRQLQQFGGDNWHFACISDQRTLEYTLRCLLFGLGSKLVENITFGSLNDRQLGHLIILSQFEWPQLNWMFTRIMALLSDRKRKRTRFSYPKFFNYVYCMDILEEIAYLNTSRGAELTLDITETESTRKIGASTRHSVKDQKGDVRSLLESHASIAGTSVAPSLFIVFLQFVREQKESLIELL